MSCIFIVMGFFDGDWLVIGVEWVYVFEILGPNLIEEIVLVVFWDMVIIKPGFFE